ncbi:phosphoglycerate kinase [Rhodopirellula europaea]|uniref:phosphoglycerate kinase n=1 Tax=Rhodopirellula europaea TaxID=1263866 RepID=UPI003D2B5E29|tara:strand:- start:9076 stop:9438 length:363 start_codon:yes stop_codon:yes gene_type:complete
MGLDMYAMTTTEVLEKEVDFKVDDTGELHYWRKHPNLHGWMERLYYDKGGTEDFNCVPVVLNVTDLDQLEIDIQSGDLPDTSGFFFGESEGNESEDDLEFIAKARRAIADGQTVFYDSWW